MKILHHKYFWDWATVGIYVILVAIFFYPTVLHGKLPVPSDSLVGLYHPYRDYYAANYANGIPFKNFLITDPVRQQIPWRKSVIDVIKTGHIPTWDPFDFSGAPLLANIQSGAFYPLNVLFLFLPYSVAWALIIISQPLLSGLFLYIFLRHKKIEALPSLFGAVCFAFSGFSVAWLTWGTIIATWMWTPLSLVALDQIGDSIGRTKWIWVFLLIFSISSSFFAGHSQIFFYSVVFLVLYGIFDKKIRTSFLNDPTYASVLVAVVLLTSSVWIRMVEWLPTTSRLANDLAWKTSGFFIPVQHLVQFFVPDYFGNPATLNYWGVWNYGEMVGYIGVIGLIFAALGMSMQTIFWIVIAGGSLLFAVSSPLALLPFQLRIPIISTLQPTRLLVVIDFCLSVLAAYGLANLLKGLKKGKVVAILASFGIAYLFVVVSIVIAGKIGISPENALVAKRNVILPLALFIGTSGLLIFTVFTIKKPNIRYIISGIAIVVLVIDLFRFGWKFTPFTDASYFFPETKIISFLEHQQKPFRVMTTDDRILPPNVNEYYGIESINGYDPIHSARYEQFVAAMERGKPNINPPFGFDRIIVPKNFQSPLFKLLNVRYILSFAEIKDPEFRLVTSEGMTKVYEYNAATPRAYLVSRVQYKANSQDIINALYSNDFHYQTDAVVEQPVKVLNFDLETSESATIKEYSSDHMIIHTVTAQPRFMVLDTVFDPHEKVTINGKIVSKYRVNYLFTGVVVPSGNADVTLQHE